MIYIYTLIACAILYLTFKLDWEIADNKMVNALIKFMLVCLLVIICYILFIILGLLWKLIGGIIIFLMEALI